MDHLLIENIDTVRRSHHAVEGKPIGYPQQSAEIARILYAVEKKCEALVQHGWFDRAAVNLANCQNGRRRREMADAGHFIWRYTFDWDLRRLPLCGRFPTIDGVNFAQRITGGEQFGHDLFSLDDEQAEIVTMFLVAKRAEAGDFSFGKHFSMQIQRRNKGKTSARNFFIASTLGPATLPRMKIAALFRGLVVLALVFVALYVGMSNTQPIQFSFPLAFKQSISQPAALIFFGMFALGLIIGLMLVPRDRQAKNENQPAKKKK